MRSLRNDICGKGCHPGALYRWMGAMLVLALALIFTSGNQALAQGPPVQYGPFQGRSVTVDPDAIRPTPGGGRTVQLEEGIPPQPVSGPGRPHPPIPGVQLTRSSSSSNDLEAPGIDELSNPLVNVPGILSNANPPDTVGDVGPNHYVQMTNAGSGGFTGQTVYQIFDKSGNDVSGGPIRFGGLWPGADPCNDDVGDPIVVYDHLADRWNLSQFDATGFDGAGDPIAPFHMCIAISQTPNPNANSWFIYTITMNPAVFPDYPKFGVWPDGYYMSSYEGANLGVFAFDRANMVLGNAITFFKTTISSLSGPNRNTRILPADLDGPAPAFGTPNYFVHTVDDLQDNADANDRIDIYEFTVNWLANTSSFTLAQSLRAADGLLPFDTMACDRAGDGGAGAFRDCIPQPDVPDTVDALSNRPMMQLKYRILGGEPKMVFNQTIDVGPTVDTLPDLTIVNEVAGIRWYELRKPAAWAIEQQGTYAAQPAAITQETQVLHRWMGSAAMDKDGNIAIGYSIVNDDDTNGSEVYPGIRYTGRLAGDLPGVLTQGEKLILNGANSQTGGQGRRWGDYSALNVDPVDDCTFWYTTHVANTTAGPAGKPTRIASFHFPGCNPADLAISKSDSPDPVTAGNLLQYTITVLNSGPANATNVVVTDTLPAGVNYNSSSIPCSGGAVRTCSIGNLAAGDLTSFTLQVRVPANFLPGPPANITNTATVSATELDPDTSNNTATASTLVIGSADLSVAKVCKPDGPAPAGSTAFCDITVSNAGVSDAHNVVLKDGIVASGNYQITLVTTAPVGVVCIIVPGFGTPTTTSDITCNKTSLAPGDVMTIHVEFTSSVANDVNDTATVDSPTTDPDNSNNSATGHVSFVASAGLSVTKASAPDPVVAGTNLTYTLTVNNGGPSPADNVVLKDTLPGQVSIVSVTPSVGSCTDGIPGNPLQPTTCTLGTLAASSPATVTIVVKVNPSTPQNTILVNNATVTGDAPDPDNSDNSATELTTVNANADLVITKTSDKATYKPNALITFTVQVTNNGPSDALAVVVTDTLPAIAAAIYLSNTGGCTKAGNVLTCNMGNMPIGTSKSFNVNMKVRGNRGTITNTASVASSTTDIVPGNNTSIKAVQVK